MFFKIFCKTILRIDIVGYWFNLWLKLNRVKKENHIDIFLSRTIIVKNNEIEINDKIFWFNKKFKIGKIFNTQNITTVHSPSSRFIQQKTFISNDYLNKSENNENDIIFNYKI